MINEGRKENTYNKFQKFIEAEKKLVSEYLPDGLASLYDYLVIDPFIEKTNYKYLEDLLDVHYSDWKQKENISDNIIPIDKNSAKNYIFQIRDKYDRIVKALQFFDINNEKYDYSEFSKYKKNDFFDFLNETDKLVDKAQDKKAKKEVEKIYEDNNLLIVRPKSYEGSCLYGAGTKWCTASKKTTEHWENYTDVGLLYYLITKGVPESNKYYKVALFITDEGEEQWWDAADNRMDENNVELLLSAYGSGINRIREHFQFSESNNTFTMNCVFSSEKNTSKLIKIAQGEVKYIFKFREHEPGEVLFDLEVIVGKANKTLILGSYILHISADCATPYCQFETLIMENKFENGDLLAWDNYGPLQTNVRTMSVSCQDIFMEYFDKITSDLTKMLLKSPIALNILSDENTIIATGYGGNYKFSFRDKGLIKKLIDWLNTNKKGTRMDFLVDAGMAKKKGNTYYSLISNSPIELRGFYSTFFSSVMNAGIIKSKRQGNKFYIVKGPNFNKFVKGAKIVYV
jgi:hypothetical protein